MEISRSKPIVVDMVRPIFDAEGFEVSERSSEFLICSSEVLGVGGCEGEKYLIDVGNSLRPMSMGFVSKEYRMLQLESVMEVIAMYDFLRARDYLVPNTSRYYIHDRMVYLLMSDMTEGGEKLVWGCSDDMTDVKNDVLRRMMLSANDLTEVKRKIDEMVGKATDDGVLLAAHWFHIMKSEDGFEIGLLDVGGRKYSIRHEKEYVEGCNSIERDLFLNLLGLELMEADRG